MLDALRDEDFARFTTLADEYGVTHAVGVNSDECGWMARAQLQHLYSFGDVCAFARIPNP
jgi:hypothetical protein